MSGGCAGSVSEEAKARAWHSSAAAQLSRAARARPSPIAPPSHRHSHRRPARAHVTDASAGQADWWCVALLTGFVGSCEYGHCARRQACASGHSARQHRGSVDSGGVPHTVPQLHAPATVRARPAAQWRWGLTLAPLRHAADPPSIKNLHSQFKDIFFGCGGPSSSCCCCFLLSTTTSPESPAIFAW